MFTLRSSTADHEALFVERYAQLLAAAHRLTGGQRDRAEELVQEAFIQFTLTAPALAEIRNLDGYLYGVLRKLHLSQARRGSRAREVALGAIDYDSIDMSLSHADARMRQQVMHELAAICTYASERKYTSKAASVLILRFFHGYYPAEIGQILRIDVRAVDEWRRIARREAKTALGSERRLSEFHPGAATLRDLRASIFGARAGECLTATELSVYGASPVRRRIGTVLPLASRARTKSDVDCATAAHITSCERCLNEISRRLGIATLDERSAEDNLGPGRRDDDPPPPSESHAPSASIRRARRRGTQVFEHRPAELHIAVNGLPLVWQSIGSEPIDQHVNVTTHEAIEFVEVFSEQDVRLLFLNALPPAEAMPVQTTIARLSGRRTIALALSFAGAWPSIHLTYRDPEGAEDAIQEHADLSATPWDLPTHTPSPPRALRRRRWAIALGVMLALTSVTPGVASATVQVLANAARRLDATLHFWISGARQPRAPLLVYRLVGGVADTKPTVQSHLPQRVSATPRRPLAFADLAALELDVLRRLDGIDALLGERVTVRRSPKGVHVEAIAEHAGRQAQIDAALAPLAGRRGLTVDVTSVAERLRAATPRPPDALVLREVHVERDAFAAWEQVQGHLERRDGSGSADALRQKVREFANQVIARSDEALVHTWAVQRLTAAFSLDEQQALPPDTYDAWRALIAGHARVIRDSSVVLRSQLDGIFDLQTPDDTAMSEVASGSADLSLHAAIDRLTTVVASYDRALRTAFMARDDAGSNPVVPVAGHQVVEWMREAERLAEWLVERTRS